MGRLAIVIFAAVAAVAAGTSVAAQTAPVGDVARFRALRAEAIAAANAEDLPTATARLVDADAVIPNHPGLIMLRARVAAAAGDAATALAQLERYADAGLTFDAAGDAAFVSLADLPGFATLSARFGANLAPVGKDRLTPLADIAGPVIVEAVAADAPRARWLASQVAGRTIVALDAEGAATPFLRDAAGVTGVLGLALDDARGVLWAASSPLPPALHGREGPFAAPMLLRIDAASGRVLGRYAVPPDGADQALGDVALGPDGAVYASDSTSGEIFVLRPGAESLDRLVAPGVLGSPQGLVAVPDGSALIVADYSSGLYRIDLDDGTAERLVAPAQATLIGIDGLTRDDDALYAFQNGVRPQRVLEISLDADWREIEAVDVVAANLDVIDEPTNGLVVDGDLVFVARSQWSDFAADGAPRAEEIPPARIVRLDLR